MTAISRQNALFVAEDWKRIYEAISNIDFSSYDQKNIRSAIVSYIQLNYPDEFNDWIQSSEFIIKLDTLSYMMQSLSYRLDLNTRENMMSAAERRESILNLVSNITYNISRVRSASGEIKLKSLKTNQPLIDLDDNNIANKQIKWNDPIDSEWFDKWLLIMNAAFDPRTKWGRPLRRSTDGENEISLYRFNSPSPPTGVFDFTASVGNTALPFNVTNVMLDEKTGIYDELMPDSANSFHILYRNDNLGASSASNGFFFAMKQGDMNHVDFRFDSLETIRTVNINTANINNDDVWVSKINDSGEVIEEWTKTDNVLNESIAYNSLNTRKIFEVITRDEDQIAIRFGDGKFGEIPQGLFRIWYRTASVTPYLIRITDIKSQTMVIPYVSNGQVYNLTIELSLQNNISNASSTETIEEIKKKASKVYYTQNRMVNGEDYNSFPLKDNSILKIKTVNRTYAGKSKNLNLKDQTGAYNNITLFADDGRLYKEQKVTVSQKSYNNVLESLDTWIEKNVATMLRTEDKQIFYYNHYSKTNYSDLVFTSDLTFAGATRGHFNRSVVSDPLFQPGTIIYLDSGEDARLDFIVQDTDGTEENNVYLKKVVNADTAFVTAILPPLRRNLIAKEREQIIERMMLKKPFGIRWNYLAQTYDVIRAENLSNEAFSLENTGSSSGNNLDSSWLLQFTFNYTQNGEDYWTIDERGMFYVFESEAELNFIHVNDKPIVDFKTGKRLRDTITLLDNNETRNSLRRRGATTVLGQDPYAGKKVLVGDGTTKIFELQTDRANASSIFFEENGQVVARTGWELTTASGRTFIKFNTALSLGEIVTVVYDPRKTYLTPFRIDYDGDSLTDTFSFRKKMVRPENTFVFHNGLIKATFEDYKVYTTTADDRFKLDVIPNNGEMVSTVGLTGGEPLFNTYTFTSDGTTASYALRMHSDVVMVFIGGQFTQAYTHNTSVADADTIEFNTTPTAEQQIHIKALNSNLSRVDTVTYTATAGQQQFSLPITGGDKERCLVFVNGVFQHGFTFDDVLDDVILSAPLAGGEKVVIYHFTVAASFSTSYDIIERSEYAGSAEFLEQERQLLVYGQSRFSDGYTNPKAVLITNVDADFNGLIDNPLDFQELVIEDGLSDLVLWRKITENSFEIWSPISENSLPRGTYHSKKYQYAVNEALEDDVVDGSIHYDLRSGTWLIADVNQSKWVAAEDQTAYKKAIGRDQLKFRWVHYTSSDQQINISPSNLHDAYVLTKQYDREVRQWVVANDGSDMPTPPSLTELKNQYSYLQAHKTESDTMIWNPATYKCLFGPQALPELQCKFLVVKTVGSTLPDNDLKLKILQAIDDYFALAEWDFGERFYFMELGSYVQLKLATHVQSFVPVALSGEPFGRMFEIRCEPHEIFLNTATPTQIEVVDGLTDSRLNISA